MLSILSIACIAQSDSHLDSYSIQIGAYKHLPDHLIKAVEKFGSIHTLKSDGLTRISVGNFNKRSKAQELLLHLKQAGYHDAFISRLSINTAKSSREEARPSDTISEMDKYSNLSKSDKEKAVFINGKLHLKEGNQFIPVL